MKDTLNLLWSKYRDIIYISILISLCYFGCNKIDSLSQDKTLLETSMNSKLSLYKDKEGKLHGKITTLQADNAKTFLELKTNNNEIKELQELVRKYKTNLRNSGSSASVLGTSTNISGSTTTVTIKGDSIYPEYCGTIIKSKDSIEWIRADIRASKDSISLDTLVVRNNFDIVIGYERKNLFSKRVSFADVTAHNPFTTITKLRTFQVTETKKRWVVSGGIGYGLGINGAQPVIGVFVGYKLLEL